MNDLEKNSKLEDFIQNKIKKSLKRFNNIIKKVEVRLTDENGPKGGDDKSCMIYIKTDQFAEIVVNSTRSDSYASVSNTVIRAKRTIARRLKQSRSYDKTFRNTELIY